MGEALPLSGVVIVEICHSIAGPYGGSILAQLGAKVVKVESPEGDDARAWGPPDWEGASTVYQAMNRDKLGVAIDLKDPAQADILRDYIVEHADIVLQSLRPGAAEKLGFGGQRLMALKPQLIYCNLGSFGAAGPLSTKPGYDPLMQARSGLMSVTGEYGREPVRVGTSIVDMGTGMWCAIGILAALHRRQANGVGCIVDASLFETSLAWMTVHIAGYSASGEVRKPMGSALVEIVPHQAFRTTDGYVMVAAGNDSLFRRLANTIGRPALADDERFLTNGMRVRNRAVLIPLLEEVFLSGTTRGWVVALEAVSVPVAPLQQVNQALDDEQAIALGIFQRFPEVSDLTLVGIPLSFDGVRAPLRRRAPTIGQHNHQLFNQGM